MGSGRARGRRSRALVAATECPPEEQVRRRDLLEEWGTAHYAAQGGHRGEG